MKFENLEYENRQGFVMCVWVLFYEIGYLSAITNLGWIIISVSSSVENLMASEMIEARIIKPPMIK